MKFLLISPKNRTAYNFRGDLIKEIQSRGYEVIVTGPNQDNMDKIMDLGVKFVEIPMNKNGLNPMADIRYLRSLIKLAKKEQPVAVLGYTSKPVIYGSIAAKIARVPHKAAMVTGAGYAFTAKTTKAKVIRVIMSILYKCAFWCCDTAIFQNNDDAREFVHNHLVKQEKCIVVNGSGVNTEQFPVAEYPSQITFFMLSRVMYSKGIREYLEACTIVKQRYPHVRCMLLGACEDIQDSLSREALQPYIDNGIIDYYGETDRVTDYYRQCSVYVLPSYREGTPRTVLEAMSMGRPIITTDAPGCRETVIDGETGFLVPVQNSTAVAEKMIEFIKHPEKILTMGAASAKYCRQKYDVHIVNQSMCKALKIREEDRI